MRATLNSPTFVGRRVVQAGWLRMGWAVVCLNEDCGAIFDVGQPTCPGCASEARMPLALWLDREDRK